ncbi:hypothetical protein DDE83_008429 [Stemphylium lycopersici]|uniref:Uncharacterized protein n=1 Tax=Stemphylium lycopersici TaxID=183478 RepID=A0A364MTN3_STELY|nr:hypothetical protein DDE83_008429 [Stemphylium lycopersici]
MISFRDTIRANASSFTSVFKQKAKQQYEDGCLKAEAYANEMQQSAKLTAPHLDSTGMGDAQPSYQQTEWLFQTKTKNTSTTNTDCITQYDEPQLASEQLEDQGAAAQVGGKIKETNRLAREAEHRQMMVVQDYIAGHRATRALRSSRLQKEEAFTARSHTQFLSSPSAPTKHAPDMSFYDNQTSEESLRYVQERLTAILGPERMKLQLLPSGHNPIDPVIEEHYQQVATNDILSQWEIYKAEIRQQEEEHQRQVQEEEAVRLKAQILLTDYRNVYVGRLEKLALYGSDLAKGVDLLEAALQSGSIDDAARVVRDFTQQVLLPIDGLIKECSKEIPLEEVGAEKLKGFWPIERLNSMYKVLKRESNLPAEALYMLQGIEAICNPIKKPTPFQDPFAPKPAPIKDFRLNFVSSNAGSATNASSANGFSSLGAASTPAQKEAKEQQNVPASEGSGFSKLLAATAEKANGSKQEGSGAAPNMPPISIMPPKIAARENVLRYVATENMAFESEVQDLIRNNDVVNVHRRQARACLQEIINKANGEEGFLEDLDAGNYRTQIEDCVTKINTLPAGPRMNRDTQALKKLCGRALKLWAVHAK